MIKNIKNILGLSILESIIATAIVGIGFVAILQMTNFSAQSIDSSGERTKANYLVSMIAEDVIGHKNTLYGLSSKAEGLATGADGSITHTSEAPDPDDPTTTTTTTTTVEKFVDHLLNTDFFAGRTEAGPCAEGGAYDEEDDVYGAQQVDGPRNKISKWQALLGGNRYLKCKGRNDIKKMKVFKICRWADRCTHVNNNVYEETYIGRIQVNLNNGKKRKFLYFQADYKIRK